MTTDEQPDTRIYINAKWHSGDPCIYGTRVPVWCVVDAFAAEAGATVAETAEWFDVTEAQALEALRWQLRYYEGSKKERQAMKDEAISVGLEWEREYEAREKP